MDEPTNNLDLHSLIWLETFLKASKKSMIIISHDLYFLDNITNRVIELTSDGANMSKGKYSDYVTSKEKDKERQMKEYKKYQEEKTKLENLIQKEKDKGNIIEDKKVSDRDKVAAGFKREKLRVQ